ncbi:MAG: hypothetical protein JWO90_1681 [Solirubrobacterales bacterium]|jgi:AcrR family transcriptional regulator|nr:hypothetical protein [Solirubrobacterales bacterium]
MSRRLRAPERRAQLLDVLERVVLSDGFAGVSIDRIAREGGIARTVVYSQFGNLGGMLDALVERVGDRALAQVKALVPELPSERDPDDILLEAITAFTALVVADPALWRLVLFPPEGAPPVIRARIEQGRAAIRELVEPVLAWGIEARGGPEGLDPELSARLLITLGEDAARLTLSDPVRYPPERMERYARTLLGAVKRG